MVVVLNPLFSSCCKIGKREAGKFERARGLKALASVLRVPCKLKLFASEKINEKKSENEKGIVNEA